MIPLLLDKGPRAGDEARRNLTRPRADCSKAKPQIRKSRNGNPLHRIPQPPGPKSGLNTAQTIDAGETHIAERKGSKIAMEPKVTSDSTIFSNDQELLSIRPSKTPDRAKFPLWEELGKSSPWSREGRDAYIQTVD